MRQLFLVGSLTTLLSCTSRDKNPSGDNDNDGHSAQNDCNDERSDVYPGAAFMEPELCTVDADGDGYGDNEENAYHQSGTDCDDSNAAAFPGAAQLEPGLCTIDADGDGYGDSEEQENIESGSDCNDASADINPGSTDACDGNDGNCDGDVDNPIDETGAWIGPLWYPDGDGDGFGTSAQPIQSCYADGYANNNEDCDDTNPTIHPAASEICDHLDNDCDEAIDFADDSLDEQTITSGYEDSDGDGFGNPNAFEEYCLTDSLPFVQDNTDCNDGDGLTYPGAEEICGDSGDNNCDGSQSKHGTAAFYSDNGLITTINGESEFLTPGPGTLLFCSGEHDMSLTIEHDISISGIGALPTISSSSDSSISINSPVTVNIENLAIANSVSQSGATAYSKGGGIKCSPYFSEPDESDPKANVTLSNVDVFANEADKGGGIFANGCNVTITNSSFSENKNTSSPLANGAAISMQNGDLSLNDTVFNNQEAQNAAIYVRNGDLDMTNCEVSQNTGSKGSGLYFEDGFDQSVSIDGGTIEDNVSVGDEGALHIGNQTVVAVDGTTWTDNQEIDISAGDNQYNVMGSTNFDCQYEICGSEESEDFPPNNTFMTEYGFATTANNIFISNVIEVSGSPTINEYKVHTNQYNVAGCDADFHLLKFDPIGNDWETIYAVERSFNSPWAQFDFAVLPSGHIGHALKDGDLIALTLGFKDNDGNGIHDCDNVEILIMESLLSSNTITQGPFAVQMNQSVGPTTYPGSCGYISFPANSLDEICGTDLRFSFTIDYTEL